LSVATLAGELAGALGRWLLGLALAPLLLGVINRVKAFFGGRRGQPVLQPYLDIIRLLRKGAVYSPTTTWVFRAGPMIGVAACACALLVVPLGRLRAVLPFAGDLIVLIGLLALARLALVLAALDTGSAFEGMGASREVMFSAFAEPALLLALAAVVEVGAGTAPSLSSAFAGVTPARWQALAPSLALAGAALFVVLLAENSRIPVDDPNTHLELTMIHEVMVLDHSGPDFAFVSYGAALKLWLFATLLAGFVVPVRTASTWLDGAATVAGIFGCAVAIGVVESTMARLRMVRVSQLLIGAGVLAALAVILLVR
jgi:formate hydrogenlyase subunit 4